MKATKGKGHPLDFNRWLKLLTPKQMAPILPIALAQVKASNAFKNLLGETRQIIYSLYGTK